QATQAAYVKNTWGNKGAGVIIGMLEDNGMPVTTDTSELTGANIVCQTIQNFTNVYRDHSTRVAAILVGKNNGVAPAASLYATGIEGEDTTFCEFYKRVEWLLDRGINVINMSCQLSNECIAGTSNGNHVQYVEEGKYDQASQWVDHIAMQHDVHFVKSAGNGDDHKITSPGMAYNIITVGSFNDNNTGTTHTDDVLASSSCYEETQTPTANAPEKPDLVAPGENITVSGLETASGTSFAAPQVTGIIAQLISCQPSLAVQQRAVKAILLASAWRKLPGFTGISGCAFFDDKQGAGKVDSKNARYVVSSGNYMQALVNASGFPYTKTISVGSVSSLRVALVWNKRNTITSSSHVESSVTVNNPAITNFKLEVIGPNGLLVSSDMSYGNVEIVELTSPPAGTYTIRITRISGSETQDSFALAWW
nr:S8 family serine peptidase [bacterium]